MWILKFCVTFLTSSRESNGQDYIIRSNYMPFGTIGWAKEDDDNESHKMPIKKLKKPTLSTSRCRWTLSFLFLYSSKTTSLASSLSSHYRLPISSLAQHVKSPHVHNSC
ncbi:predicted protein [Arabidopsis lyrata subsp. lyrata]|uniref:Predicted protein n=1 Tax=Arabidopsis lyrata subsp. lyrata TaxID=81972 RepID=D7KIB6_ARALL|nr:predicted protein [Arabidopsis lyrata subsp. lyrata]